MNDKEYGDHLKEAHLQIHLASLHHQPDINKTMIEKAEENFRQYASAFNSSLAKSVVDVYLHNTPDVLSFKTIPSIFFATIEGASFINSSTQTFEKKVLERLLMILEHGKPSIEKNQITDLLQELTNEIHRTTEFTSFIYSCPKSQKKSSLIALT